MGMNSPEGRNRFQMGKSVGEGVHGSEKLSYRTRFELGLLLALGSMVLLFGLSRRIPHYGRKDRGGGKYVVFALDPIPVTKQGGIPRPPNLPQVPMPTEDEYLPEDETIDSTRLVLTEGIPLLDGRGEREGMISESGSPSKM